MPIYDFKCQECDTVSEILFRSGDDQTVHCPDCGSINMEKLISSSYVVKAGSQTSGRTCCGRAERCETPPCSTGSSCKRN